VGKAVVGFTYDLLLASNSFFFLILAREKAETLGSPLISGFATTGVCACGVIAVSSFCKVAASVRLFALSTFEFGFSVSA
jgi:small-conductance mechanosensitive channel